MQIGQKQKSPGNKVLINHGRSSSPAFLKQAACVCVSAAAYYPLGGQWRLKRLEFGMSSRSHFQAVLFGSPLRSVCGGSSVFAELCHHSFSTQFATFFWGGGSCHICFVNTQGGACCHVNKLDIPVLSPLLSSASSNYFFNPLI